jgi:hypothetical protein
MDWNGQVCGLGLYFNMCEVLVWGVSWLMLFARMCELSAGLIKGNVLSDCEFSSLREFHRSWIY